MNRRDHSGQGVLLINIGGGHSLQCLRRADLSWHSRTQFSMRPRDPESRSLLMVTPVESGRGVL